MSSIYGSLPFWPSKSDIFETAVLALDSGQRHNAHDRHSHARCSSGVHMLLWESGFYGMTWTTLPGDNDSGDPSTLKNKKIQIGEGRGNHIFEKEPGATQDLQPIAVARRQDSFQKRRSQSTVSALLKTPQMRAHRARGPQLVRR